MNKFTRHLLNIGVLGGAVLGACIVSANVGFQSVGYVFFLINGTTSTILLLTTPNYPKSLLYQNLFFIVLNIIGFVRYLP